MAPSSDFSAPLNSRGRSHLALHLGPFIALALVFTFFALTDSARNGKHSAFLTPRNLQTVAIQTAPIVVAGLGMTLIIIAGGIDLSAGTTIALCATILAHRLEAGASPLIAIAAAILCGASVGAANGILISWLRIIPFIVTLGTMTVALGIAKILARETTIRPPLDKIPDWLSELNSGICFSCNLQFPFVRLPISIPTGVLIALLLSIAVAAILRWTVFGRHLYAVGSNETAARLCGINVTRLKILLYAFAGIFIGIAGIYQFSKLSSGSPTSGVGLELRIIAAVVIGGASLEGGRGNVLGTICGALIMSVISNGCTHLHVSNPIQDIILGGIIITAVTIDQLRQRRRN